jgi:hypothetical protein
MNPKERSIFYKEFLQTGQNLTIGSLEELQLTKDDLIALGEPHGPVIEAVKPKRGPLAIFVIKHHGHLYEVRLLQDKDLDHSFLHECMIRNHLTKVPSEMVKERVVRTLAMDYHDGYIVSEVQETTPLRPPAFVGYEAFYKMLWDLERSQLFATELSPTTLAMQGDHIVMTDVAHLVPFNPLTDYNEQGLVLPQAHMVERFEKHFLIDAWGIMETTDSIQAAIENIKIAKAAMLIVYMNKLRYVQSNGGSVTITAWMTGLIDEVKKYLVGPDELWQEYMTNRYRGYVKDMVDELDQPSIHSKTIAKLDFLIQYAQNEEAKERYLKYKNDALRKPIVEEEE